MTNVTSDQVSTRLDKSGNTAFKKCLAQVVLRVQPKEVSARFYQFDFVKIVTLESQ